MITERERQLLAWIEENPLISQQELALRGGITRSSVAVHISNLMKKGFIQGKGYILQTTPYVAVVGGVNMDVFATPHAPLVSQDSNPGKVYHSLGGVGRNIAHNLTLLGESVKLITAFGADAYAEQITRSCRDLGIDISQSVTIPAVNTSTYLFITNHCGDMELAVSDMDIYEHITPDFLSAKLDLINRAQVCVADTNIPAESLRYLAENCTCPLFVDTVSTAKAVKLNGLLGRIHTLKPNRIEAQLLSGVTITDEKSLAAAAQRLLELGLTQVFVSLSGDGCYCADASGTCHLPCFPSTIVNTSGAGDSFMAALVWAHLQGLPLAHSAYAGLAASSITVASNQTISADMSAKHITTILQQLQK